MGKIDHVKRLLFDYGGTLDTGGRHWSYVLWDGYRAVGVPVSEEAFRSAYVGGERALARRRIILPADTFHDLLLKKLHLEAAALIEAGVWHPSADERKKMETGVADYCYGRVWEELKKSRRVLRALRERFRPVLVTNFYGNMPAVLRDFGLDGFFSAVIESAVVGVRKPDPAIWTLGLEAAACRPEEACAVGDSFGKDVEPARSLGIHTVWFKGRQWEPRTYDETLPDAVITDLDQLPALLGL